MVIILIFTVNPLPKEEQAAAQYISKSFCKHNSILQFRALYRY